MLRECIYTLRGQASADFIFRFLQIGSSVSIWAQVIGVALLYPRIVLTDGKRLALSTILVHTGACYCLFALVRAIARRGVLASGCQLISCQWKCIETVPATSKQGICFGCLVALLCIATCIRQLPLTHSLLIWGFKLTPSGTGGSAGL